MDSLCKERFCYCHKNSLEGLQITPCCASAIVSAIKDLLDTPNELGHLKTWVDVVKRTLVKKGATYDNIRSHARRLMRIFSHNDYIASLIQLGLNETSISEDPVSPPNDPTEVINAEQASTPVHDFVREFTQAVRKYTCTACYVCDRLMYHNGLRQCKLLERTVSTIKEMVGSFSKPTEQVPLCHRCHGLNLKGRIPPQSRWNLMCADAVPDEINELSEMEITLISQIKPFMRIFHVSQGRGQFGLKGGVIHFPQCVEEISEQLPLRAENADVIIVNQSLENVNSERRFMVRPAYLRRALEWLKQHNPLYSHIQISEDNLRSANIDRIVSNISEPIGAVPSSPNESSVGYHDLSIGTKILRGTLHQSSPLFHESYRGHVRSKLSIHVSHSTALIKLDLKCRYTMYSNGGGSYCNGNHSISVNLDIFYSGRLLILWKPLFWETKSISEEREPTLANEYR